LREILIFAAMNIKKLATCKWQAAIGKDILEDYIQFGEK